MTDSGAAVIFSALADPNRIKILRQLLQGEKCASELLDDLDITQPTLSYHMKILCSAGIVQVTKVGIWMHYSISQEHLFELCREVSENLKYEKAPEGK